jgi:TPR repeat protein
LPLFLWGPTHSEAPASGFIGSEPSYAPFTFPHRKQRSTLSKTIETHTIKRPRKGKTSIREFGFFGKFAKPRGATVRRTSIITESDIERECSEAQFWLGVAYEQDWFGTVDHQEALKWYWRAAEGGDPDAQVELGQRYEDGEGVEQNYKLAAEWFRRAAEHVPDLGGAGQGRNRLGLLYLEGLGVPLDYVRAYFWFSLNGSEGNTTQAKTHLSPAQIREADRLVKEWKQLHRVSPEITAAVHIED